MIRNENFIFEKFEDGSSVMLNPQNGEEVHVLNQTATLFLELLEKQPDVSLAITEYIDLFEDSNDPHLRTMISEDANKLIHDFIQIGVLVENQAD